MSVYCVRKRTMKKSSSSFWCCDGNVQLSSRFHLASPIGNQVLPWYMYTLRTCIYFLVALDPMWKQLFILKELPSFSFLVPHFNTWNQRDRHLFFLTQVWAPPPPLAPSSLHYITADWRTRAKALYRCHVSKIDDSPSAWKPLQTWASCLFPE